MTMSGKLRFGCVLILAILLIYPPQLSAFFNLNDLPESSVKGDFYTIEKVEKSKTPGIAHFTIQSSHGIYEVEGFLPLIKVLHEISVIEQIKRHDQGGFFDGAEASVAATGTGLKNLAVHPVNSVKGIGKAAGRLGRGVGGMFRSKQEGEKSSFGEKVLGSNERELAKQFHVDVYTSNPYLKALLRQIAQSRLGGKSAVLVISFLIPIAAIASIALTAGSVNEAADQLINDRDRMELYRMNKSALTGLRLQENDVKKFLDNPRLTPREQTYLRFYLEKLKYAEGFHEIFYSVLNAKTDWEAYKHLYEAQIAANYDPGDLTKIESFPEGTALHERNGRILLVTAWDDIENDEKGKYILWRAIDLTAKTGFPVEIWNGGKIEPDFVNAARSEKIKTKPWVYLLKERTNENL